MWRRHLNRLNAFHHRCIRIILGITSMQQWEQRITSAMTWEQWEDMESVAMKVTKRQLEWLGHVARMDEDRMPKQMLFGWLPQTRPQGGPRRRWRDVICCDLRAIAMSDKDCYKAPLSRTSWRETYSAGLHATWWTTCKACTAGACAMLWMQEVFPEGRKQGQAQVHSGAPETNLWAAWCCSVYKLSRLVRKQGWPGST